MKYATWSLNFTNPNYGTGPEALIAERGGKAEGGWADGEVELGAIILGYVQGDFEATGLETWSYTSLTTEQALAFAQAINPDAYFTEQGYIVTPMVI